MKCKTLDITAKLRLIQPLSAKIYYIKTVITKPPIPLLTPVNTVSRLNQALLAVAQGGWFNRSPL